MCKVIRGCYLGISYILNLKLKRLQYTRTQITENQAEYMVHFSQDTFSYSKMRFLKKWHKCSKIKENMGWCFHLTYLWPGYDLVNQHSPRHGGWRVQPIRILITLRCDTQYNKTHKLLVSTFMVTIYSPTIESTQQSWNDCNWNTLYHATVVWSLC